MRFRVLACAALAAGCGPSIRRAPGDSPARNLVVEVHAFAVPATPEGAAPLEAPDPPLAERIAAALREAGIAARAGATAGPPADLVVEGEVTQLDRGNRGMRYAAGAFSDERAGAARFAVRGRVIRADGTSAGEFGAARRAGVGLFGGNGTTLLGNCMEAVAYDVAAMVVLGDYRNRPENTVFRANALFHP